RADRCTDTLEVHGPEERGDVRAEHAGVQQVSLPEPHEVGEAAQFREPPEGDDIGRRAPDVQQYGAGVASPQIVRGGEPVGSGKERGCPIMEPAVRTIELRPWKCSLHGTRDERDPLRLVLKTVGKLPAHHDGRRIGPPLHVAQEVVRDGCLLPEGAVVEVDAVLVDNLEIRAPDIDPDHSCVTFPCVSNRTLPFRWTPAGPSPFEAAMRRSAISSSMQAAIPTRLVVIRGFTSTT